MRLGRFSHGNCSLDFNPRNRDFLYCVPESLSKYFAIATAPERQGVVAGEFSTLPGKTADLLPVVYEELRQLAGQMMARRTPGQTLQATALVHEAFLRLSRTETRPWESPAHFYSAAAEAMRRILIDQARRKGSLRRGGGQQRLCLDDVQLAMDSPADHLLATNEALDKLAAVDPARAELVKLRFFAGLSVEEAGKLLGLSERTVKRHWAFARAWLYQELTDPG